MLDALILHPQTKAQLLVLAKDPPHALLLLGTPGVGKCAVAEAWAGTIGSYTEVFQPDERGIITIDHIRALYTRTRARHQSRQVVVIDHAETMSPEAQNAFLKLLEEPRPNLTFVLCAPTQNSLLPTILSRVQSLYVHKVSTALLQQVINQQSHTLSSQQLTQLLFMADGRPALCMRLLADPQLLAQHTDIMQQAKQLLSKPIYHRLAAINTLVKDRDTVILVLHAMVIITRMQLMRDGSDHWVAAANALNKCLASIAQNGNPRAQLTHMFMAY